MYRTLKPILLGKCLQAERTVETSNAALLIEQKIAEAEAGQASAKRGLAALIVKIRSEEKALTLLGDQIEDMTDRARRALTDGNEALGREAAVLIAQMEDEYALRTQTIANSRSRAERVRLAVSRNHRKLISLRQGLITARTIQRERAAISGLNGRARYSVSGSIREGEAVLSRLLDSDDPAAMDAVLEEVDDDLSGQSVLNRLAEAGCGPALKTRPDDVLERLRADTASAES